MVMMIYIRTHLIYNLTEVADKHQWVRFTARVKRTWCCHFTLWRRINSTLTPHPSPHMGKGWSPGGRTTLDNRLALQGINEAMAVNTKHKRPWLCSSCLWASPDCHIFTLNQCFSARGATRPTFFSLSHSNIKALAHFALCSIRQLLLSYMGKLHVLYCTASIHLYNLLSFSFIKVILR